jgi:hypothetical protein
MAAPRRAARTYGYGTGRREPLGFMVATSYAYAYAPAHGAAASLRPGKGLRITLKIYPTKTVYINSIKYFFH